jgi:hypothetical protein
MAQLEIRLFGPVLHLNRQEGCWASVGQPELQRLLSGIPEPWRSIVLLAIQIHKLIIGSNVGADGIDIHFNWAGFAHWFGPIGPRQACP